MRWMRRRGDRVRITTGKYAGHQVTVESTVYQRTVDYSHEFANRYSIWAVVNVGFAICKS